MKRLMLAGCLGLFARMSPIVLAQVNDQRQSPRITLKLPSEIASETVQINYFMLGPFGGYGGFVTSDKGRVSYDIPASVDGKLAESAKVIAYMPGCEIAKLEITMQGVFEARTVPCIPLDRIQLHGRVMPISIAKTDKIEIQTNYLAIWGNEFFGIMDGPVTSIHVATAFPDEEGRFEVELPDLFRQAELGEGSFQFLLRDRATGNIIATLVPANMPQCFGELAVRSSYAPFVVFSADTSVSTPRSTNSVAVEDKQEQ